MDDCYSEILPFLWWCRNNKPSEQLLEEKNIKGIITDGLLSYPDKYEYLSIMLPERSNQSIKDIHPVTTAFIEKYVSNFKNVIVSCSNSLVIICAYMMTYHKLNYETSEKIIRTMEMHCKGNTFELEKGPIMLDSFKFQLQCLSKYGTYPISGIRIPSKKHPEFQVLNFAIFKNLKVYFNGIERVYLLTYIPTEDKPDNCTDIILEDDSNENIIAAYESIPKYDGASIYIVCSSQSIFNQLGDYLTDYLT